MNQELPQDSQSQISSVWIVAFSVKNWIEFDQNVCKFDVKKEPVIHWKKLEECESSGHIHI
jgi:hypothetical protein